jgi:hypothetical protein
MKERMLIIAISLITAGLALISVSAFAQEKNEFTVPLTDQAKRGKLKAHINFGSITVKGVARKDVLVKYVSVADEEDDDEENEHNNDNRKKDGLHRISGGGIELEVTENSNLIKVNSDSWNNKINLEIEVPSGFDLDVSTYNDGDVIITNIQGELEITNFNGAITALNISGSVVATTYNGDVKITFDKVTDGAPMSYATFNGDIDVTFPATVKGVLKLKTEQGEIFTGFDVAIKSTGPVQKKDAKSGVYKVSIDEWKRGDLNGGGPEMTMKTYNGDIYVRKK